MVLDNNLNRFPKILKDLFGQARQPTKASLASAAAYKKQLCENIQVDSFHLELKMGPPTQIPWSCNTGALLGCKNVTYEEYIKRVHPDYHDLYFHFGVAAYRLSIKYKDLLQEQKVSYNIMVPLRHEEGHYLWFNQVSVPSGFDEQRHITHHINSYRLVCEFQDAMLLSRPLVIFEAEVGSKVQSELQQLSAESILDLIFAQHLEEHPPLTQNHRRILLAWCKVYAEEGPEHTHHKSVAKELDIKPASLKKYVQPVLAAAREVFPLHPMKEMNDLGRLMVGLFGFGG
ncbi:MAG: hypothetical protein RIC19_20340 [Phaeodactylibacter sp.]|uniref:hypothetical protein n=1 Tax=Phaeodactylibacter sp. TaxID=1940289 RepID=UPI0032ECFF61